MLINALEAATQASLFPSVQDEAQNFQATRSSRQKYLWGMSSGVASMEQMEQLLPPPRAAQDHFRNSCKSDEMFWR